MFKIIKTFLSIFVLSLPLFFCACSSSSYYERYEANVYASNKKSNSSNAKVIEDESSVSSIKATDKESESIFNKLSFIVGSNKKKERFLKEIVGFLNTPYKYGGETRNGIDCSAFTQQVFRNSLNVKIPRTAREQYRTWNVFNDEDELVFGDLIYFNTSKQYFPGHVGIYLDNNLFAHASSTNGVIISSLDNNYYRKRFVGANRVKIKK